MANTKQFLDWLAKNVAGNKTLSLEEKKQFAAWLLSRLTHAGPGDENDGSNLGGNIANMFSLNKEKH